MPIHRSVRVEHVLMRVLDLRSFSFSLRRLRSLLKHLESRRSWKSGLWSSLHVAVSGIRSDRLESRRPEVGNVGVPGRMDTPCRAYCDPVGIRRMTQAHSSKPGLTFFYLYIPITTPTFLLEHCRHLSNDGSNNFERISLALLGRSLAVKPLLAAPIPLSVCSDDKHR